MFEFGRAAGIEPPVREDELVVFVMSGISTWGFGSSWFAEDDDPADDKLRRRAYIIHLTISQR
jgi:hypothetical protein